MRLDRDPPPTATCLQSSATDRIQFCETIGVDDVSRSPYRVPIARLAAAQAAIGEREKDR